MPKGKEDLDHEDSGRWLMTYADLITLLLAFFVIMYSMSRIDAKKFGKMSERLQGVFRGNEAVTQPLSELSDMGSGVLKIGRLKMVAQRIRHSALGLANDRSSMGGQAAIAFRSDSSSGASVGPRSVPISTEINERGLVIHVLESALFESGQATLKPEAIQTLDLIAGEILKIPNQVRVEGHTDDRPISTFRFPSNWELSSARATAVVRYFADKHHFSPERLSALGFGEFRPLVANTSDENRARNRRVDIVVLTEDLSRLEPYGGDSTQFSSSGSGNNLQANLEDNSPQD